MLQTLNEAKQKGFAALVMKAFSKKLAEDENIDIVACVRADNVASLRLFKSIGFDIIAKCFYIKTESF